MCLLSLTTSTEDGCPSNGARRLPARANLPRTGEAFESESKGIFLAILCCIFGPNMSGIFPCNGKWIAISIFNVCLFICLTRGIWPQMRLFSYPARPPLLFCPPHRVPLILYFNPFPTVPLSSCLSPVFNSLAPNLKFQILDGGSSH